jgi:cobyrinic acid a,c-diamide synthase
MCGVLPTTTAMHPRLTLGYRSAVALTDSALAAAGTRVRGHEFHRTTASPAAGATPAWQWNADGPEGFVTGNVHASYLHLNWAGSPTMASRFVGAAAHARPEVLSAHR